MAEDTQAQATTPTETKDLNIVIPEEATAKVELDYEKAYSTLPASVKRVLTLVNYKSDAESQEQLESHLSSFATEYEKEVNTNLVPLIVAKIKGDKQIVKPGISGDTQQVKTERVTKPYRGY